MWCPIVFLGGWLVFDVFSERGIFKRFAVLLGDFAGNQDETVL